MLRQSSDAKDGILMPSSRERYQTKRRLFQMESYAAVAVNLTLAIAASIGLVRLVVYNLEQQAKVDLLEAEVGKTRARVDQVREEFEQYFDPYQATSAARQQSHRIEPGQARIILTEPADSPSDTPDSSVPGYTQDTSNIEASSSQNGSLPGNGR
ncbi:MAG: hypothetical protein VKL39_05005 [Leptolyngbyaceae bacterium]|nr:hypothetical protein [Leptolyngbyaceae bacterium]